MRSDIVVDIGNSRMKWGRCKDGKVVEKATLSLTDANEWKRQLDSWAYSLPDCWAIASVNPSTFEAFHDWLQTRADSIHVIKHENFLGLTNGAEFPSQVGIDRLLTALAARREAPPTSPVIIINVGTATTIDLVDPTAIFLGGAILPGPALMARSLHDYTAALPCISVTPNSGDTQWGRNTKEAIEVGIRAAVMGSADFLIWEWSKRLDSRPAIFITGGDSAYFSDYEFTAETEQIVIHPALTLEGIRLAAEAMP